MPLPFSFCWHVYNARLFQEKKWFVLQVIFVVEREYDLYFVFNQNILFLKDTAGANLIMFFFYNL